LLRPPRATAEKPQRPSIALASAGSLRSFAVAKIGVMIEGQEGLTWDRWRHVCLDAETLGFDSLRRSDHLFSVMDVVERDCIECWTSLALAAEWTKRIEFGPMVSPMTFREPALLARMAAAVDLLAGGRLILGVGAGWYEREHVENGIPFLTLGTRMDRLEEGIETIHATWQKANPKPPRGTIPLLMGGRGEKRALPMVAREAAEWNLSHLDVDEYLQKRKVLEAACREIGRDPASIRHSVMVGYIIGRDRDELRDRAVQMSNFIPSLKGLGPDEVLSQVAKTGLVGTPEEIADKIREHSSRGVDLFMFQHFLLDDREALKLVASDVIPAVA
jgi:alkanesulfonate monooxygenase SsuD/methylene tetrahydromethanopterin reductase-like flavin-dependent oxidoreductase (luciferase family)